MVSRKRSLPMLQLVGFNPVYISADVNSGERECLALFPVGYGDEYEEEESLHDEEVETKPVEPAAPPPEDEGVEEPPPDQDGEDQED